MISRDFGGSTVYRPDLKPMSFVTKSRFLSFIYLFIYRKLASISVVNEDVFLLVSFVLFTAEDQIQVFSVARGPGNSQFQLWLQQWLLSVILPIFLHSTKQIFFFLPREQKINWIPVGKLDPFIPFTNIIQLAWALNMKSIFIILSLSLQREGRWSWIPQWQIDTYLGAML